MRNGDTPSGATLSYESAEGGVRWTLVVDGHGTVARGDGTAASEAAAEDAVAAVAATAADATVRTFDGPTGLVHTYEVERDSRLPFVGPTTTVEEGPTRLLDGDGVDVSGETYDSPAAAVASLDDAMGEDDLATREVRDAAFELFADEDGHGWRLVDETGETLVVGEGRHDEEADARAVVERVRRWAGATA